MALPDVWTASSPRDKAALDAALTQMADRYLAYQQSVANIIGAYSGVVAGDLTTLGYPLAVANALPAAMGSLNTHANDATVVGIINHLRNVGR